MFQLRYSKESPESRILIENKVRELKGEQHIMPSSININSNNNYDISGISRSNDTTPASSNTSSSRAKGVFFPSQHYDVSNNKQNKRRCMPMQRKWLDNNSIKLRNPNTPGIFGKNFSQK